MEPNVVSVATMAERIFLVGCWAAVAAVAVQAATHVADVAFWDGDVFALHADVEGNAFAWLGSAVTFAAALMAFLAAIAVRVVDRVGIALAAIVAFFSLDEGIALHERIGESSVEALGLDLSLRRAAWPLVYVPLLVVAFVLLWRIAQRGSPPVARAIRIGLGLLVLAVVAEVTSTLYLPDGSENTWKDAIEVVIEEGAELGGWMLVATGLAARAYLLARAEATA